MKVDESKPVEPAKKVRRQQVVPIRDNLLAIAANKSRQIFAEAATEPVDIAAFHGLDQDDLTEKARIAMMQLIEEIEQLRQELTRQRKTYRVFSNLANHDELSTAPNRRALCAIAHADSA